MGERKMRVRKGVAPQERQKRRTVGDQRYEDLLFALTILSSLLSILFFDLLSPLQTYRIFIKKL
jgi:hypothetical protein